jgi:hypothetical protein
MPSPEERARLLAAPIPGSGGQKTKRKKAKRKEGSASFYEVRL